MGALVWVIVQVEGADLAKHITSQQRERPIFSPTEKDNLGKALTFVDEMARKR